MTQRASSQPLDPFPCSIKLPWWLLETTSFNYLSYCVIFLFDCLYLHRSPFLFYPTLSLHFGREPSLDEFCLKLIYITRVCCAALSSFCGYALWLDVDVNLVRRWCGMTWQLMKRHGTVYVTRQKEGGWAWRLLTSWRSADVLEVTIGCFTTAILRWKSNGGNLQCIAKMVNTDSQHLCLYKEEITACILQDCKKGCCTP